MKRMWTLEIIYGDSVDSGGRILLYIWQASHEKLNTFSTKCYLSLRRVKPPPTTSIFPALAYFQHIRLPGPCSYLSPELERQCHYPGSGATQCHQSVHMIFPVKVGRCSSHQIKNNQFHICLFHDGLLFVMYI